MKKIVGFGLIVPGCVSLFALNLMAQDLITGSSVFLFPRPAEGGAPAKKTTYRIKSQLVQRKNQRKPEIGTKGQALSKPKQITLSSKALAANEQLGVTLWRLRPEKSGDTGARLLTMSGSSKDTPKMIAERVALDTVFKMGEKVRISVESPRAGFLYIIDRELRKDGTLGEPYLIFPTLRTHNGDNKVGAGKVTEIPAQTDNPFYFDITPNGVNYAGELLTVIVSPTKIQGLKLEDNPILLSAGQVENWENLWESMGTTFELDSARSLAYTEEEKEAGIGSRQLTQASPSPQTIISIEARKGKAFLVSFTMRVSMK